MSERFVGNSGEKFIQWMQEHEREFLRELSINELLLLFYFQNLSERDQQRVLEFIKITARKYFQE